MQGNPRALNAVLVTTAFSALIGCLVGACSNEPAAPVAPRPPVLEPVDFTLLGAGKVMFERGGEAGRTVYLIDAGARRTTVVLDATDAIQPALSPTGDRFVFVEFGGPSLCDNAILIADFAGRVEHSTGRCPLGLDLVDPSWAPSAASIMVSGGLHDAAGLGLYQWDTLTSTLSLMVALDTGSLNCFTYRGTGAAVSPTGTIALGCAGIGIFAVRDSGNSVRLLVPEVPDSGTIFQPQWSRDGRELAYLQMKAPGGNIVSTSLRIVDTTGAIHTVTVVPGAGRLWGGGQLSLCWLPGTDKLVFEAPTPGVTGGAPVRANLFVVHADGTGLVQLTHATDATDEYVSCSP